MDFSYIVLTLSPLSNSPLPKKHNFLQTVVAQKMIANEWIYHTSENQFIVLNILMRSIEILCVLMQTYGHSKVAFYILK